VSHKNQNKRDFHIIELKRNRYKLKIKKFGIWFLVRDGLRAKIFDEFSDVVYYINKRRNVCKKY
jgi:hypothetical protein